MAKIKQWNVSLLLVLSLMFAALMPAWASAVSANSEVSGDMLPVRSIAEQNGCSVEWYGNTRSVTVEKAGKIVKLQIGSKTAEIDGQKVDISSAPKLVADKTYVSADVFDAFPEIYLTKDGGQVKTVKRDLSSKENMIETITDISKFPRHPSDATHADAMQYVIDKFEEYGYDVEKQPFQYEVFDWESEEEVKLDGTNLVAVKKPTSAPTGDILIVGAHYDGVRGMPAADDNGSGLSVMLELARILQPLPSDTEIRFVAFDAEEDGLEGSEEYASHIGEQDHVIGMLNFDMLAGAKAGKVDVTTGSQRENYLFELLQQNFHYRDLEPPVRQGFGSTDHFSFEPKCVPTLSFEHSTINGEYHSENDTVDRISADMLYYCAEAGYTVASRIMSGLTPSFLEKARPAPSTDVIHITEETFVPHQGYYGSLSEIERELNTRLTQIYSEDTDLLFKVNVKLFDLEQPLELVYRINMGAEFINEAVIDLADIGMTFDEMRTYLKNILGPETVLAEGKCYAYDHGYRERYVLSRFDGETTLDIRRFSGKTETYAVKDGALLRMEGDGTPLEEYEVTKKGGKIEVVARKPKVAKDPSVTDTAAKCWDRVKPFFEDTTIDWVVLTSDGLGGEIIQMNGAIEAIIISPNGDGDNAVELPDEYKSYPSAVQGLIRNLLNDSRSDIEPVSVSFSPEGTTTLCIDYIDLLNENGSAYTQEDLAKSIERVQNSPAIDAPQAGHTVKID